VEAEDASIFELGGTESFAQTSEEYRQVLRGASEKGRLDEIGKLPWKAGSGMMKGDQPGFFFCAKIGDDHTYLRFVPESETQGVADVVKEIGTCLRIIECEEDTGRVISHDSEERAFHAWRLAHQDIFETWEFFTSSRNLQPRARLLNREVVAFIEEYSAEGVSPTEVDRAVKVLLCPWSRRDENQLREVWNQEFSNKPERVVALIQAVKEAGLEPPEIPEPFPEIDEDQIDLICWMEVTEKPPSYEGDE
jgi:hypothetical protein